MTLTSSYRRRTAGFTSLFAALLLILTALAIAAPSAGANELCPDPDHPNKVEGSEAEASGGLVLDAGTVFCVKKGNGASGKVIADGETTLYEYLVEFGLDGAEGEGPSHYIIYEVLELCPEGTDNAGTPVDQVESCDEPTPVTPEGPGFTDPDCDTAAAVTLPETTGVDYSYDSEDVVPGGTVTVTATPQAGYEFPEEAQISWEYTFPTIDEDCDEPTPVTPEEPTFTDPTCDVNTVGLDVPADTEAVTYTVSGDQEPGGTVTVTATLAEGYVLAEDAVTEWEHTYGPEATNCGGVDESVVDPAAEVNVTCDAATIHLDNTASTQDKDVTYTITGVEGYDTVVVDAGTEQTIDIASTLSEDVDYDITVSAEGMDDANAAGTYDCEDEPTETPTTDVSPDEVERPAPDPEPTQPAAQAAAQDELPATGLGSTELLLLALLMLGLGTAALLGSDPREQI